MFSKLFDSFLVHYLERFNDHCFTVKIGDNEYTIGEGEPEFTIRVNSDIPKKDILVSAELALGEAYMRKDIEIEGDLFKALCVVLGHVNKDSINKKVLSSLFNVGLKKKDQKQQVSSHYDLGNEFYSLWLDKTMSYSCAYFKHEDDSLEEAQYQKVHHILDKLYLKEGMTLLDIGCGWGFLLIEAARKYGVKGYGCTLSEEQWKKGQERIKKFGLEGQVEIELIDYRDVAASGRTFDRIVSVGMLEHVGRPNFPLYMEDASTMLNDGGLFLLHYISDPAEKETSAWIRKYIFPGGCLPSLREMVGIAYDYGMNVIDVESLRLHYYKTLMHWYNNFQGVRDQVEKARGTEFVRMWDLYLCGCAAGFYIGNMDLHQILMTKGVNNDLPLTRWY
ncbi:cyclopropane-fatty-acyl-phospholipid synthase family protein [uncultured Veillonella sp.]|uniref:cyclopropane-fatty-acyl-phospholipid synthase family protein n=1 Tax=uncultured Veillonella sp. TaxID=159268 RepID=UPI0028D6E6DF|nr:cyclopropane-fatty-acyl-phospholipid synthase family protein [uncultured Veillonella sp.]